ncbi:MAG: protein kinase, partial [Candidatus Eremiobacterota bacterium]
MKNLLNNCYELIWEISSELISGVYLVKHKETNKEYVMKEILQKTDENDSKIVKKEFEELVKLGATLDGTDLSPLMVDFFIEEGHKYLVLEAYKDGGTLAWLEAFQSIGYIFKNCYVVACGIAAGGFGVVYQVIDANIPGKFWALKEMYDVCENPEAVERSFRVEAEILAGLDHRAIPIIVSFFTEEDKHYIVMEFIKGNTLEDMLDSLKSDEYFPEKIILEWAIQICEVIEYLHTRPKPVIFRDLKPDNIIFTYEKELKLIDFGISCIFQGPKARTTLHTLLSEGYAPQEQWLGKAEPRSDIYSLGATLHHIITRIHPKISAPDFPMADQLNPHISRDLSLIIAKSLQAKLSDRYQTMSEMKSEFVKLQKKQKDFEKEYELLESGENFERKDDNFKALSEYIKILDLNPVSERAHHRLALCYEKLGFKDKAIEHYHKAIDYSVTSDIKEKSEERLKSLAGEIIEKSMKLKPEHIIDEVEAIPAGNLEHGSYLSPKDFTLTTRFGHTSGVTSVSFIQDSKLIVSAGQDGNIKIWDMNKKILLHTLEGHRGEIKSISLSPDGQYMACCGNNVTLWDLKNKKLLHMFEEVEEGIEKVEFDSTGNMLIWAGGNKIVLHNREEGILLCTLEGHHDKIKTFALSRDNKFLCSAGRDLWVNLWDLETKKLIYSFNENSEPARAIAISPDGMLMAVMNGNKINLWDLKTREIKHVFEGHTDKVESLSFSPDGNRLASGSRDRSIKIWHITSTEAEHTVSGHTGWISDIKWSHDGKIIISGSSDKTVKMWDSEQMDLIYTFGGDYGSVESLSINPDGTVLAAGYSD